MRRAGVLVLPERLAREPAGLGSAGPAGYASRNFLGMNDSDYGGGTPLVDVWRRDIGIAVGHIELVPKQVSLPVQRQRSGKATLGLVAERHVTLAPGESTVTLRSFVAVHRGDHFDSLRAYSEVMQAQGLKLAQAPKEAFDPIWCAWGYGRTFTPTQVFETLPVVTQLGFKWAVLDDGWQIALGDWRPRPDKFPAGDADMKAMVDRIHAAGLKAQLWWAPLGADADVAHSEGASGLAAEKCRWLDSPDHLVGFAIPVPRDRPRARGCRGVRAQGAAGLGLRRPEDRRAAFECGAALLQSGTCACISRGRARGNARITSRRSGMQRRPPSPVPSSRSARAAPAIRSSRCPIST